MTIDFGIEPLAEDTLILRFGDAIEAATNARVHAAARALRAARLPGLVDVAPAYATLLLRFDPAAWIHAGDAAPFDRIAAAVHDVIDRPAPDDVAPARPALAREQEATRAKGFERVGSCGVVEIPVCYGGDHGPDLAAVAAHARLAPEEIVARHAAAGYTVAMLGFAPGFPYLLGLDPALATPRRESPRTRVPPGSVAIGGRQTGIYPRELPGGWWLIGRTPRVLFDAARDPPCLLAPGDRVRFRVIGANEFARRVRAGR